MALAVAGMITEKPVIVPQAEYIRESFPGFVETMTAFGAQFEVVE
jgi:5-enolpyruvylshikimate-3-phosphate synthase